MPAIGHKSMHYRRFGHSGLAPFIPGHIKALWSWPLLVAHNSSYSTCNFVRDIDEGFPLLPGFATFQSPASPSQALLPALTARSPLFDDLSIVARTHVARVRLADTGDDEQRSRVDEHELEDRVVGRKLVVQNLGQNLGVLRWLLAW